VWDFFMSQTVNSAEDIVQLFAHITDSCGCLHEVCALLDDLRLRLDESGCALVLPGGECPRLRRSRSAPLPARARPWLPVFPSFFGERFRSPLFSPKTSVRRRSTVVRLTRRRQRREAARGPRARPPRALRHYVAGVRRTRRIIGAGHLRCLLRVLVPEPFGGGRRVVGRRRVVRDLRRTRSTHRQTALARSDVRRRRAAYRNTITSEPSQTR
jgi:hypothetical protein